MVVVREISQALLYAASIERHLVAAIPLLRGDLAKRKISLPSLPVNSPFFSGLLREILGINANCGKEWGLRCLLSWFRSVNNFVGLYSS